MNNERGSALIEQCFASVLLLTLVAGLLFFAAVGLSKVWLHYAGNEAAICLASDATKTECENGFRKRTQILERVGHMRNFQLSLTSDLASAEWHFEVTGFNHTKLDLDGHVHLKLPLQNQARGFV